MSVRQVVVVIFALSIAVPATASVIPVLNSGFENRILPGPGNFLNFDNDIPDWVTTGSIATFKPGAAQFPGGVPGGDNVAAVASSAGGGVLSQTLAETLAADTTYMLTVDVGNRLDVSFSAYAIELIAGGVTLASGSSPSPNPAAGTFLTKTIVFNSSSNPDQLGQNLVIRLSATGIGQADFDNVRLTIPEPVSLLMMSVGVFVLPIYRRRHRNVAAA